ncbi:MAG: HD domain-containing protein [Patescibacteria group bacterium]
MSSHIANKGLQKHCMSVGFAMKALAKHFSAPDIDLWELAGILHDSDWEVTKDDHASHTRKTVEWIRSAANPDAKEETEVLVRTILSHNCHNNGEPMPTNNREWSLYCCDELTGLIVATTLIMPSKKLADVSPESVIKKMGSKNFAAAVDREGIKMCEEKLGIPLPEFVKIVLTGMQEGHIELGL